MTKISVILPTYNRADILKDTIDDLFGQKTSGEFEYEVIVVDNNSTDRTREVVGSYVGRFPGRITYMFEPKQARAHALNAGLGAAKGEIVVCVDDDCSLEETYLWNVHKAFKESTQDVGVVGGRILPKWIDGDSPRWLDELFSQPTKRADGTFNDLKVGFQGVVGILDLGDDRLVINEARKKNSYIQLFGANMTFRKAIFSQYGNFSATNRIGEDTEMCERLIKEGVKIIYAPDLRIYHKIPVSKGTPKFYYHWWFNQGVNADLREKLKQQSNSRWRLAVELIRKIIDLFQKFMQEKDPLTKIHWRTRMHYYLGQIIRILKNSPAY